MGHPDRRGRASTAGPDEPDRYKSDGRAPDSPGEWSAFRGEAAPERRARAASCKSRHHIRRAAERPAARQAVPRDSVSRADATDCRRRPDVDPHVGRA